MSDLNKMISGEIYNPSDETLSQMRANARKITAEYNRTSPEQKYKDINYLKIYLVVLVVISK